MFHEHHHRSAFPLLVTALTLGLVVVLSFLFRPFSFTLPSVPALSYEQAVAREFDVLDERLAIAQSDDAKEALITESASYLLSLSVSSEYQEAHLNLVSALDALRRGYGSGDAEMVAEGESRLLDLQSRYPWL